MRNQDSFYILGGISLKGREVAWTWLKVCYIVAGHRAWFLWQHQTRYHIIFLIYFKVCFWSLEKLVCHVINFVIHVLKLLPPSKKSAILALNLDKPCLGSKLGLRFFLDGGSMLFISALMNSDRNPLLQKQCSEKNEYNHLVWCIVFRPLQAGCNHHIVDSIYLIFLLITLWIKDMPDFNQRYANKSSLLITWLK